MHAGRHADCRRTVDEAVEGIAAGVRYYLTKPYSGAMLIEIVNLALQEVSNIKEPEGGITILALGSD